MPIRFRCPCGQKLKTPSEGLGKRAKCPKCGKQFRIPESATYETIAQEVPPENGKPAPPQPAGAPAPEPTPAAKAPIAESDAPKGEMGKGRVLVADSLEDDLKKLVVILRDHGYVVLEATDGQKALDMVRSERPDAVILNVKLNLMSGFQVIQQLRNPANPVNKEIWDMPVLMVTEKLHGRDRQYAMSLGVDGYFVKPVPPAQICARLERAVYKRHPH